MKPAHILAIVILLGAGLLTLFSFSGATAPYVTARTAMAKPGQSFQVQGRILRETVQTDKSRGVLRFDIEDHEKQRMTVTYAKPKPDTFETATDVNCVGKYEDGIFKADNLLLKCPSKYSDEKKVSANDTNSTQTDAPASASAGTR